MGAWNHGARWALPILLWLVALLGPPIHLGLTVPESLRFSASDREQLAEEERGRARNSGDADAQALLAATASEEQRALNALSAEQEGIERRQRRDDLQRNLDEREHDLRVQLGAEGLVFLAALGALAAYKLKVPLASRATWRGVALAAGAAVVLGGAAFLILAALIAGAIHG